MELKYATRRVVAADTCPCTKVFSERPRKETIPGISERLFESEKGRFLFLLQDKEFVLHKLKRTNKRNTMMDSQFLMIADVEAVLRRGKATLSMKYVTFKCC